MEKFSIIKLENYEKLNETAEPLFENKDYNIKELNTFELSNLDDIKYIIIPRLFYPDKPNMNPGSRYHSIVSNKFNEKNPNNTGPGLFFEAYWNGGLLYLFMVIFYFSVIMFSFSKIIVQNLIQKKFFIFILIVNAIYLGRGIDDWFTGRYGTFVLYVIVIYLINLLVYNSIQYLISSSRSNKFEKI